MTDPNIRTSFSIISSMFFQYDAHVVEWIRQSIIKAHCERCDEPIHPSDKYALCTDPWGGHAELVCENCREQAYDREQERLMEDGPGPSLIEQQQAAWRMK